MSEARNTRLLSAQFVRFLLMNMQFPIASRYLSSRVRGCRWPNDSKVSWLSRCAEIARTRPAEATIGSAAFLGEIVSLCNLLRGSPWRVDIWRIVVGKVRKKRIRLCFESLVLIKAAVIFDL